LPVCEPVGADKQRSAKTDMDSQTQHAPLPLDSPAAAAFVGVGIGVLRGWVADGLPFCRAGRGGRKMFTRQDLVRWVERIKEAAE